MNAALGLAALCLATSGSIALALAMTKHHREVFGQVPAPARARLLRAAGYLGWAGATVACLLHWGGVIGTVIAIFCLSLAGLPVALLLAHAPRRLPLAAAITLALALLLAALAAWAGPIRDPFPHVAGVGR